LTTQLVVVRDSARVWLIGSGPTPAFGHALACAIRQTAGRSATDVVNTRAAPELSMGNVAFADARLWALADVIAAMRQRCETCRERLQARIGAAGASLQPDQIRVPDRSVAPAGASAGRLGPFDWRAYERADGERVLALRHRRTGVVIAQGLLWSDGVPDLRDTRSDRLLVALRGLQGFGADATYLGEQGEPATAINVAAQIGYLEALRREVRERLRRGEDPASAVVALPQYAQWPGYSTWHRLNVQHVWRELEPEIFR
jgi:hypothetical protein